MDPCPEDFAKLATAFAGCNELRSLSGQWDFNPYYLPAIYSVCAGLTSLNFTYATLRCPDLVQLLRRCTNLQRLLVLDYIEDRGLKEIAASLKDLQVLRVLSSDIYNTEGSIDLTEQGLVSVAVGCPKIHCIEYCCSQMTNAALCTIARHMPNLTQIRVMILEPKDPDYITNQPLDNGYMAIVERCKSLNDLLVTGLVTDRLLKHIGTHGKKLDMLALVFLESGDKGLQHVLSGCSNLRKLFVRDGMYSGQPLLAVSDRLEGLQLIWLSSCRVSYKECKLLAEKKPRLNVEIVDENGTLHSMSEESLVETVYIYRTVAGPRVDMHELVLNTKPELLDKNRFR